VDMEKNSAERSFCECQASQDRYRDMIFMLWTRNSSMLSRRARSENSKFISTALFGWCNSWSCRFLLVRCSTFSSGAQSSLPTDTGILSSCYERGI
jgi:hypothetical protein